jgi:hypothetical protein
VSPENEEEAYSTILGPAGTPVLLELKMSPRGFTNEIFEAGMTAERLLQDRLG